MTSARTLDELYLFHAPNARIVLDDGTLARAALPVPRPRYRKHSLLGTCGLPPRSHVVPVAVELAWGDTDPRACIPLAVRLPGGRRVSVASVYQRVTWGRPIAGNLAVDISLCLRRGADARHLFFEQGLGQWLIDNRWPFALTNDDFERWF